MDATMMIMDTCGIIVGLIFITYYKINYNKNEGICVKSGANICDNGPCTTYECEMIVDGVPIVKAGKGVSWGYPIVEKNIRY